MNLSQASSYNELLVNILIEELYRHNIDTFFISPGSRSTPLTTSVAYNEKLTKHIHIDERTAAFAALGYARATGKPGVLICTSGSAGANYFPAVCEASADSVPIIIITADRPPELHGVLANQTCNQKYMFGQQVRCFMNIEPPDKNMVFSELLHDISFLIQKSIAIPTGPVHINCMFREPLVFKNAKKDYSKLTNSVQHWIASDKPFTKLKSNRTKISFDTKFDKSIPAILIAGALKTKKEAKAVVTFAEKYNLPIFPDVRSGLRLSNSSKNLITYYDQLLTTKFLDVDTACQVIHIGGNIVSKRLLQFIEKSKMSNYLVIHNSLDAYNPHHKMTESQCGSIEKLLKKLSTDIKPFDKKFLTTLKSYNKILAKKIEGFDYKFSEISIVRELSQFAKKNSFIYSANSLSVRLIDMFADVSVHNTQVIANRGLSGIDGTVASAIGYANGLNKSGTLLIGDLAFQHDIGSLALVKKSNQALVIVLLNNNGGKIFSSLPIAKEKNIYEEFFETPLGMTYKHTAKQYDIPYYFISSTRQFHEIYQTAQQMNQTILIEVACQDSEILNEQKKISNTLKKLR